MPGLLDRFLRAVGWRDAIAVEDAERDAARRKVTDELDARMEAEDITDPPLSHIDDDVPDLARIGDDATYTDEMSVPSVPMERSEIVIPAFTATGKPPTVTVLPPEAAAAQVGAPPKWTLLQGAIATHLMGSPIQRRSNGGGETRAACGRWIAGPVTVSTDQPVCRQCRALAGLSGGAGVIRPDRPRGEGGKFL